MVHIRIQVIPVCTTTGPEIQAIRNAVQSCTHSAELNPVFSPPVHLFSLASQAKGNFVKSARQKQTL